MPNHSVTLLEAEWLIMLIGVVIFTECESWGCIAL